MKLWKMGAVALAISTLSALLTGATVNASTATPAATCAVTWGTQTKSAGLLHTPPLLAVRAGQHTCFDRVVFEYSGLATGYRIGYAADVLTEGRGLSLRPYTAGTSLLSVVLRNPTSSTAFRHTPGDHVANVAGFATLRDVVFGGSFEGQTTFAVGVRTRLPFRVFRLTGPGSHNRIVLDIAHH